MIGKLKGGDRRLRRGCVIVDVNGVGYLVHCSSPHPADLPPTGEAATLLIETHVREDAIALYGFADAPSATGSALLTDRAGRRRQGGARRSSSAARPGRARHRHRRRRQAPVWPRPGVGPKLAQRIVAELKDKAAGHRRSSRPVAACPARRRRPPPRRSTDAVSALVNLGYAQARPRRRRRARTQRLGEGAELEGADPRRR